MNGSSLSAKARSPSTSKRSCVTASFGVSPPVPKSTISSSVQVNVHSTPAPTPWISLTAFKSNAEN